MKLLSEAEDVATVAERWKAQYLWKGKWGVYSGDSQKIYERLAALPSSAKAADVAAIIGNNTWIGESCSECGNKRAIIMIGQEPDYESATVWLCRACVDALINLVSRPDDEPTAPNINKGASE
jgi:hypothetical protein